MVVAGSGGHVDRKRGFLWTLRPYLRQVAGLLVIGSVCGVLMNTAVVLPAVLLGRALDAVLRVERHRGTVTTVGRAALLFVAGTAATEVPRIGKRWWLGMARVRLRANIRSDALRGVLDWPMDRLATTSVGEVMSRVIGDIEVLGTGVGEVIVETWDTLLFSASLVVAMFLYDARLAAVALAPVPAALLLAKASGRMVARRTTIARERAADLTEGLHEQLSGVRVLRLFGRSGWATGRIGALSRARAGAELGAIGLDEALAAVYTSLLGAGAFAVVWMGGHRVVAGQLSVGSLVAFLALFVRFVTRAPRIPQMANRVQAAGAAFARLEPLLAPAPPMSEEPPWSSFRIVRVAGADRPLRPAPTEGVGPAALSFMDASFAYPGATELALVHITLDVAPGSFVAVTGPIGSGKSALARLAAGLYAPAAGEVLLDGRPLARADPIERASRVGYLSQDPHLFSGTVVENILLGAHASVADGVDGGSVIERAVAVSALSPDLAAMPSGLGTEIGELGVRVSGGQRARIGLARAIVAAGPTPGLLVLDDPFSSVDLNTEAAILGELQRGTDTGTTILLCSHRLAAFPGADVVVVLDRGRIVEQGRHRDLLGGDGLYARIYRAQVQLSRTVRSDGQWHRRL